MSQIADSQIAHLCRSIRSDSAIAWHFGVPIERVRRIRGRTSPKADPNSRRAVNYVKYGSDAAELQAAKNAREGSQALLQAIFREHPERCAV